MVKQSAAGMDALLAATLRAVALDLPLVAAKRGVGMTEKRTVTDAVWQGYDASMLLGRSAIERLYESGLFGSLLGRSVHGLLRVQRLNNALMGAFFAALWRVADFATATELSALREELRALAATVAGQGKKSDAMVARSVPPEPRVVPNAIAPIDVATATEVAALREELHALTAAVARRRNEIDALVTRPVPS